MCCESKIYTTNLFFKPTAQFSDSSKQTPSGYTSILTVESSDYLATGFYTCFGDHEEASVYVYVSDEENLLAVNPEDTMLLGHQYQDIIIPCKPTSPDVNVTLKYHDRPVSSLYTFFVWVGRTLHGRRL